MASATMVTGRVRTMTQIIRDDPVARPDAEVGPPDARLVPGRDDAARASRFVTVFAASLSRSVMTGRPLDYVVAAIMHRIQDCRSQIAPDT